jgi:hypothetical protein
MNGREDMEIIAKFGRRGGIRNGKGIEVSFIKQ